MVGLAAMGAVLAGCKSDASGNGGTAPMGLGIDPAMMDRSTKPGDDFNVFANGTWLKNTPIPADRSVIGGFLVADQATEAQLGKLIAQIERSAAPVDTDEGRIRDFYKAFLDMRAIDAAGLKPLQPDFDRFAAIQDGKGLSRVLGEQLRADVDPLNSTDFQTENLFGIFVTQSLRGTAVMPYVLQGGLGMPERAYYLSNDQKMAEVRGKYRAYIARLLADAGIPDAQGKAERIFALETKIAGAHETREQSEDFQHSATEWSRGDFAAKAPGIDWDAFFAGAGLSGQQRFAAYHALAIPKLSALVASQPLEAWKDWLLFHQINSNADVLPSKLDADHFAFYGATLTGTAKPRPRPKRAIMAINAAMGDALGRLYVRQYFPPKARAQVQEMVKNIKAAFVRRVEAIAWMAPATKREAIEKVRTIEVGVGYPDRWRDYSTLRVGADTAYANRQSAGKLRYRQQLDKIGKPLDRREWWMNAQLVNAVNLPVQNALNFPAAILQRPFFDPAADAAFNYGAIGAVIGHEISHSFDNNGAAFDAAGKMRNWWTPADLKRFNEAAKALVDQYDTYQPLPGLHVDGRLTLSENIADVAGLAASFEAYHASLGGRKAPVIGGFTGDQRFFIAFAQTWATKMREAALRQRIATDGHAPGQYRAETVRNLDAWYDAFGVRPGEKLYLPVGKRVRVW
jgi:endothelin-converting enzyme/putative endopeptidase